MYLIDLLYNIDVTLFYHINLFIHTQLLDNIMQSLTAFGLMGTWVIIILLILLFDNERKKEKIISFIASLIIVFIIVNLIKYAILRPRPYEVLNGVYLLYHGTDPSFPSGHSATAAAGFYILGKEYNHLLICILLAILIGISRIYIGVHYPSDVIVGLIIGFIISKYTLNYIKTIKKRKKY
ncbi:MAG: phosphatase PAP2 family protein [Methanobacteriaceae archaeon]|nr:phosphatase PAP2 family protein [Methanobacteriaceae archaeon]